MRKCITIISFLFLIPIVIFADQPYPDGWLTPYANAAFKEGKIVYSVSNVQQGMALRLLPLMYPRDLVSLSLEQQPTAISDTYIGESQAKIRNYLTTEPISQNNSENQDEYLRLTAMALMWDMDLPKPCIDEIKKLQASASPEVKANAEIVMAVLKIFQESNVGGREMKSEE